MELMLGCKLPKWFARVLRLILLALTGFLALFLALVWPFDFPLFVVRAETGRHVYFDVDPSTLPVTANTWITLRFRCHPSWGILNIVVEPTGSAELSRSKIQIRESMATHSVQLLPKTSGQITLTMTYNSHSSTRACTHDDVSSAQINVIKSQLQR